MRIRSLNGTPNAILFKADAYKAVTWLLWLSNAAVPVYVVLAGAKTAIQAETSARSPAPVSALTGSSNRRLCSKPSAQSSYWKLSPAINQRLYHATGRHCDKVPGRPHVASWLHDIS